MRRTIPTFSMAIEHEKRRWRPFRNALHDKSDRKDFDKMFDIPRLYTSACSNSAQIIRLHPILMSILLHHFKQLTECIEQVKQMEAKVEEEIGLLPLQQQQQRQQKILLDDILTKPTKLSQEQSVAVISGAKSARIIAGAGAGKTEVLTRRVVYLLLVKKIPPSSIVAFTFTEKAALNMKNRIYERVEQLGGGGGSEKATANLGEMYIGTIHGYAKRLLEDKFGMGDYDVLDENQEIAYVIRHARSLELGKYERRSDICSEFIRSVNMVWEEMISDQDLEDRAPDFYRRMKNYEARLQNDRRLTFGKMIHSLVIKLQEKPEAVENVRCLLVDEYQDINGAQAELIRIIGKKADVSLFVVGDPRQSIFQWRGSDERFFHTFSETFPNSELFSINENRRSVQQIVKLANHVADTFEEDTNTTFVGRRKYEHLKAIRSEEEDVDDNGFTVITQHRDKDSEAQWVVQQIELLLGCNKELKYSDFAILLRSTNTSAIPFQLALKAHNIPFIVGGKVGLFKRDEAQALGRIFAWLSEECFWFNNNTWDRRGDKIQGDDVLRTGLECWIRVTKMQHTVQKGVVVVEVDDMDADVEVKLNALNVLKKELLLQSPKPRFKNLTEVFYNILNILGYQELDPSKPLDEVIMANLGIFHNLLTDYEAANRLGGRSIKWSEDLNGLCLFMNTYATEAYGEQQSPPSDDIRSINAIQIKSIHQAKGLEWPVVFVPALVRQRFPSSLVGEQKFWCNIPRDMCDADRYEGTVEDERRLFYVAITRAKDVLVLSFFGDIANSSPFLRNLDGEQILLSLLPSPIANGEDLPRNLIVKPSSSSSSDSGAEMHSISAEEIITYEKCPQLYRFTKIWSYRPALRKEMGYGNSLHFCLRKASELIKSTADYGGRRLMTPIDAIRISIDKNFHMPFVGGAVLDNFKRSASKVLTGFATNFGDDLLRVQEVEYRVEFPVQDYYSSTTKATIMGRVDVIMKNNDEVEVRDYKTSEDARSFENAGEQIKLYTLGLKRMGWPVTVGSIAYLEGPEIRGVDVSEKALQQSQNKSISLIEEILHGNFKAKPSEFCCKCDCAKICKWEKKN